jgi:Ni2+-binding GTPase involved in maturation of urease and hydrogenase
MRKSSLDVAGGGVAPKSGQGIARADSVLNKGDLARRMSKSTPTMVADARAAVTAAVLRYRG